MIGNFCTLLIGLALAAVILLLEILLYKYRRKTSYPCKELHESGSAREFIRSPSCENVLFKINERQPDLAGLNTVCYNTGGNEWNRMGGVVENCIDKVNSSDHSHRTNDREQECSGTSRKQFHISSFLFKPKVHFRHRRSRRKRESSPVKDGTLPSISFKGTVENDCEMIDRTQKLQKSNINEMKESCFDNSNQEGSISPKMIDRKVLQGGPILRTDFQHLSTSAINKAYLPDNPLELL